VRPLTPDDLLPLDEYAARRAEFAESHRHYCDRYRRVRVGPGVELFFENRQTLWFRAQELLRVMHTEDAALVRAELDACNRLLPRRHRLLAGVTTSRSGIRQNSDLGPGRNSGEFRYDSACVRIDGICIRGRLLPILPEDRALGVAAWIEFSFAAVERTRFADSNASISIELTIAGQSHDSGALADEVRQSLIDDLKMSESEAS
jgi:hypothetical protein